MRPELAAVESVQKRTKPTKIPTTKTMVVETKTTGKCSKFVSAGFPCTFVALIQISKILGK